MKVDQKIAVIKNWISKCIVATLKPAKSLVVGISGGIDFSVVSTICASTGIKTFALSMPIKQIKCQLSSEKKL